MHATQAPVRDPGVAVPSAMAVVSADDSAVSWAAILAGAAAAAALSLILVLLGLGLGLSAVSPWSFEGVSAETFGWATIAWISFTSFAASGLGGYLAGRLRRRWSTLHGDETYFRDTAHGFLSWAVATLLTAALLTSSIAGMLGGGGRLAVAAAEAAVASSPQGTVAGDRDDAAAQRLIGYHLDRLFRQPADSTRPSAVPDSAPGFVGEEERMLPGRSGRPTRDSGADAAHAEVERIVLAGLDRDREALSSEDADHVTQLVMRQTGLNAQQARTRVDQVHGELLSALDEAETRARELADEAREASAYAALWLFITLLIGAFFASLFATFGGRQRDNA